MFEHVVPWLPKWITAISHDEDFLFVAAVWREMHVQAHKFFKGVTA